MLALSALGACGGDDDGDTNDAVDGGTGGADGGGDTDLEVDYAKGPILPLTVGSRWVYKVTAADKVEEKVLTVDAEELIGGDGPNAAKMGVKLIADRGSELTHSWVLADGDKVVRCREEVVDAATGAVKTSDYWDPNRVYADASEDHRATGATWLDAYTEVHTKKDGTVETSDVRESWSVLKAAESVTVPAGTFTAVVYQKSGGTTQKQYYYVPGIGKVKETGGQTEELTEYEIAK